MVFSEDVFKCGYELCSLKDRERRRKGKREREEKDVSYKFENIGIYS